MQVSRAYIFLDMYNGWMAKFANIVTLTILGNI